MVRDCGCQDPAVFGHRCRGWNPGTSPAIDRASCPCTYCRAVRRMRDRAAAATRHGALARLAAGLRRRLDAMAGSRSGKLPPPPRGE